MSHVPLRLREYYYQGRAQSHPSSREKGVSDLASAPKLCFHNQREAREKKNYVAIFSKDIAR